MGNDPRTDFPENLGLRQTQIWQEKKKHYGLTIILNHRTTGTAEPEECDILVMQQLRPWFSLIGLLIHTPSLKYQNLPGAASFESPFTQYLQIFCLTKERSRMST